MEKGGKESELVSVGIGESWCGELPLARLKLFKDAGTVDNVCMCMFARISTLCTSNTKGKLVITSKRKMSQWQIQPSTLAD